MSRERLVLAFGGGKGGVGKSLVCSAVATALAQRGLTVVALDADLGAANLHTLLGLVHPGATLDDFWSGRVSSLEDICLPTDVDGLRLLSGAASILRSANPRRRERDRLLEAFFALPADVLLMDLGAGTHESTLDLFNLAGEGLIVTGTEPTAIQNAYAFIKGALFRALDRAFVADAEARSLVERAIQARGPERIESVERLLAALDDRSPAWAERAAARIGSLHMRLVVNQAAPKDARRVLGAVGVVCQRYLGFHLPLLGALPPDQTVSRAVHRMAPVLLEDPECPFALAVHALVETLLSEARLTDIDAALATLAAGEPAFEPLVFGPPTTTGGSATPAPHSMAEALRAAGVGANGPGGPVGVQGGDPSGPISAASAAGGGAALPTRVDAEPPTLAPSDAHGAPAPEVTRPRVDEDRPAVAEPEATVEPQADDNEASSPRLDDSLPAEAAQAVGSSSDDPGPPSGFEEAPVAEPEAAPEIDAAPVAESEAAPEIDEAPVAEPEAAPEIDAAPVAEPEWAPEIDAAPVAEPEWTPETDAAPVAEPEAAPEIDAAPVAEPEAAPENDAAPVAEPEAAPEIDEAPEAEPEAAPEIDAALAGFAEPEWAPEIDAPPVAEPESAPEIDAPLAGFAEPESAPEADAAPVAEPESAPEADAALAGFAEPEAAPEADALLAAFAEPESAPEADAALAAFAEPESAPEADALLAGFAEPESALEADAAPVADVADVDSFPLRLDESDPAAVEIEGADLDGAVGRIEAPPPADFESAPLASGAAEARVDAFEQDSAPPVHETGEPAAEVVSPDPFEVEPGAGLAPAGALEPPLAVDSTPEPPSVSGEGAPAVERPSAASLEEDVGAASEAWPVEAPARASDDQVDAFAGTVDGQLRADEAALAPEESPTGGLGALGFPDAFAALDAVRTPHPVPVPNEAAEVAPDLAWLDGLDFASPALDEVPLDAERPAPTADSSDPEWASGVATRDGERAGTFELPELGEAGDVLSQLLESPLDDEAQPDDAPARDEVEEPDIPDFDPSESSGGGLGPAVTDTVRVTASELEAMSAEAPTTGRGGLIPAPARPHAPPVSETEDVSEWSGWAALADELKLGPGDVAAAPPAPSTGAQAPPTSPPAAEPAPAPSPRLDWHEDAPAGADEPFPSLPVRPGGGMPLMRPTLPALPRVRTSPPMGGTTVKAPLQLPGLTSGVAAALEREAESTAPPPVQDAWDDDADPWASAELLSVAAESHTMGSGGSRSIRAKLGIGLDEAVSSPDGWLQVTTSDLAPIRRSIRQTVLRAGRPVHVQETAYAETTPAGVTSRVERLHGELVGRLRGEGLRALRAAE